MESPGSWQGTVAPKDFFIELITFVVFVLVVIVSVHGLLTTKTTKGSLSREIFVV